ncbi:peptidoglycan-binding protein [Terrisporobacter sp.]|uniref:peptidoglycan-binding protein n=1 Tax=Terrisporobacter sp. TaxID=1965305 RepID=UPI00261C0E45|nr:peptidoglycan-binding protein [Terrisporobacter sp.]
MQSKYGFIMFDNINEFENWLRKQKITRKISKLQVHHMGAPDYSCWKTDEHFRRQNNLRSFHKNNSGFSDIAQHFSIFPDGKIMTGRSLNSNPAGISGWNTGAVCVEIYGNFDYGKDIMTKEQRESVIACYAIMCKVFNLTPSESTIRPHAWFKSDGTYLGTYRVGQSRKTCPGTNFMGYGNTKEAFKNFYRDIKNYQSSGQVSDSKPSQNVSETTVNQEGMVNATSLNVRSGAGTNCSKVGSLKNNTQVTIVAKCSNGWLKIKYGSGYGYVSGQYIDNIKNVQTSSSTQLSGKYIVRYLQQVLNSSYKLNLDVDGLYGTKTKNAVKSHLLKKGCRGEHVTWLQKALINRGYKINADGIFGNDTLNAVKKYQQSRGLKSDGYAGVDTHTAIVND